MLTSRRLLPVLLTLAACGKPRHTAIESSTTAPAKFVTYQGARMIEGWPEKIQAAQREPFVQYMGRSIKRIPYGSEAEDWGANDHACHDCKVIKGQFHVATCCGEACPVCQGQMISCACDVTVAGQSVKPK